MLSPDSTSIKLYGLFSNSKYFSFDTSDYIPLPSWRCEIITVADGRAETGTAETLGATECVAVERLLARLGEGDMLAVVVVVVRVMLGGDAER